MSFLSPAPSVLEWEQGAWRGVNPTDGAGFVESQHGGNLWPDSSFLSILPDKSEGGKNEESCE